MTAAAHRYDAPPPPAMPDMADAPPPHFSVETRFGRFDVKPEAVIAMPHGILGFDGHDRFALIDVPGGRLGRFRLLQSLRDADLSFVVMPLNPAAGIVDEADLDEVRAAAGVPAADAAFLLIVTARKKGDGVELTANLRAPIVLDAGRRTARQCVLSSNRYSIRHAL